MNIHLHDLFLGFLSAAISVLTVHECLVLLLKKAKYLPDASPWSTKPIGMLGVPTILNSIFWGGFWGVIYVLVKDNISYEMIWAKGLIFGLLIALLSNFILLPIIKNKPMFMGYKLKLVGSVLLILSGFGIATAEIYEFLQNLNR